MQAKMVALNERWQNECRTGHLIRIGINTGVVTVGNLGTQELWDYAIVGHEVNKAQRLESSALPGGLLLSRCTYALALKKGLVPPDLRPAAMALKGLGEEPDLYSPASSTTSAVEGS